MIFDSQGDDLRLIVVSYGFKHPNVPVESGVFGCEDVQLVVVT